MDLERIWLFIRAGGIFLCGFGLGMLLEYFNFWFW